MAPQPQNLDYGYRQKYLPIYPSLIVFCTFLQTLVFSKTRQIVLFGRPMRDHILKVAEKLFYEEGIRAIGIDRIVAEADIAKATLYRHFPAKTDLVAAYLKARNERVLEAMGQIATTDRASPAERIRTIFRNLHEKADTPSFRGCAFMLALAESEGTPEVVAIAREHKSVVRQILLELCRDFAREPERLSKRIALCYEGALATVAVDRDPDAAQVALDIVDALVEADSATPRP